MSSDHVMSADIARLLLKISREHHFSIDDLDDWKQHLEWREFEGWLETFLRVDGGEGRDIQLRLQAETLRTYPEFANDNRNDRRILGSTKYRPRRLANPRRGAFLRIVFDNAVVSVASPPQRPSETLHGRESSVRGQSIDTES